MEMPEGSLETKYEAMQTIVRELRSVAVAFSAGADSTLVLKVAMDTLGPKNVVAVTGRSDSLARAEFEQACELAETVGAEHVVLDTDEFDNPNYVANPNNRCYHCKTSLYEQMSAFIRERGINAIVNGMNLDDRGDYRPGTRAANEHAVRSPAAEAGLTKADIRELSQRLGLPTHDKPASPCLSSRIPYGEEVTPQKLRMIEAAETFLRDEMGIRQCRVRHHGTLARVEVPSDWIPILSQPDNADRLDAKLRAIGYTSVTLDPRGFSSGSLNELISIDVAK